MPLAVVRPVLRSEPTAVRRDRARARSLHRWDRSAPWALPATDASVAGGGRAAVSDPMTHPDYATLTDWLEGRLDAPRAASVAVAVDRDPTLQQTVAWLRLFLETA